MSVDEKTNKGLKLQLAGVQKELFLTERKIQALLARQQELQVKRDELKFKLEQESSEKLASLDWERKDHAWSKELDSTLQQTFKIEKLRPYQLSTMNATLSGQDCILIMPTGGGKSLCFQLPALLSTGITLVVSPLVSLMEDQMMSLHSLGIQAGMLSAGCSREEVFAVQKEMTETKPRLKLLYVTPERLAKSKRFMAKLEKMYVMGNLVRLAIDEVHCCSQWGHDFRPDYKFLGIMKRQFPKVPIIGLTATATSKVVSDVQKILNIPGCLVLKSSFNRPNLKYEVCPKESSLKDAIVQLSDMILGRFRNQSGIIYCFSVKESEEVASKLKKFGIRARAYHAQLDPKTRSHVHRSWSKNETQVVVATIAFGMGIDKPDVRFVIHHSLSKSMENFYQESGRAGRDDKLAHCILLYRFADMFRQSTMVFTEQTGLENLYAMVAYCIDSKRCRRSIIADHFGERWNSSDCNGKCDHCDSTNNNNTVKLDCTVHCQSLYTIIRHATGQDERLTAQKLVDSWVGKGPSKLRIGMPSKFPRSICEMMVALLLLEGYLKEEFHFTPYSSISYINLGPKDMFVDSGKHRVILELPNRKRKSDGVTQPANLPVPVPLATNPTLPKVTPKAKDNSVVSAIVGTCDIEMNFNEWDGIPSSKEEKRTAKKQQTGVSKLSQRTTIKPRTESVELSSFSKEEKRTIKKRPREVIGSSSSSKEGKKTIKKPRTEVAKLNPFNKVEKRTIKKIGVVESSSSSEEDAVVIESSSSSEDDSSSSEEEIRTVKKSRTKVVKSNLFNKAEKRTIKPRTDVAKLNPVSKEEKRTVRKEQTEVVELSPFREEENVTIKDEPMELVELGVFSDSEEKRTTKFSEGPFTYDIMQFS